MFVVPVRRRSGANPGSTAGPNGIERTAGRSVHSEMAAAKNRWPTPRSCAVTIDGIRGIRIAGNPAGKYDEGEFL
jgi:hypothetical protein